MRPLFLLAAALLSTAAAPPPGARYVSMGSSYAAGPGVGTPDPEKAASECSRSLSNYAHLVAGRRHLNLVDRSCAGATTANILDHGQHGLPPQIDGVTPDAQLVSILIGGNDVDYVGDLGGLACRDSGGSNCHVPDPADIERRMQALPASLDRVIGEVRRRAPAARIILVGYLPAVGPKGSAGCDALGLSPADASQVWGVARRLAEIIGGAAARNNVGIVRSSMIGDGHEICSAQPYIAGHHPPKNPGWPGPVAFHPTQAGMDAVAAALDRQIGG